MNNVSIIAHAGAMGTAMDSLDSIITGIKNNADIVELDVRFDENNIPILSHNKYIQNKKYYTLTSGFQIISKVEKTCVNIDLKEYKPSGIKCIYDIINKFNLQERVFFTGLDFENAKIVMEYAPNIKFFINYSEKSVKSKQVLESLLLQIKATKAIGINANYLSIDDKFIGFFHENGVKVCGWTVDKKEDIIKLINFNIDYLTTKNVKLAVECLNK